MAQKPCETLALWTQYGEVIIYNKVSISDSLWLCVSIKKRAQVFPVGWEHLSPLLWGYGLNAYAHLTIMPGRTRCVLRKPLRRQS
jgi:hypothetical protein